MNAKHIVIIVAAVLAVAFSLYFQFKPAPVVESEQPVAIEGDLVKRAEYISLELRKMADQRSLWKLQRCSARDCGDFIQPSAENMRQFSKAGWRIEKMTNTKKQPDLFNCHVVNDDGQKGIMILQSPDKGKHWGLVFFSLS